MQDKSANPVFANKYHVKGISHTLFGLVFIPIRGDIKTYLFASPLQRESSCPIWDFQ